MGKKAKPRVLLVELTEEQFKNLATAVDKFDIECDDQISNCDDDVADQLLAQEWEERKETLNDAWVAIRNAWNKAGAI